MNLPGHRENPNGPDSLVAAGPLERYLAVFFTSMNRNFSNLVIKIVKIVVKFQNLSCHYQKFYPQFMCVVNRRTKFQISIPTGGGEEGEDIRRRNSKNKKTHQNN